MMSRGTSRGKIGKNEGRKMGAKGGGEIEIHRTDKKESKSVNALQRVGTKRSSHHTLQHLRKSLPDTHSLPSPLYYHHPLAPTPPYTLS